MAKNYSNTSNDVYEPAEDSFLLASLLKKNMRGKRVLDMGTGSGILARQAREAGATQVDAVDIHLPSVQATKAKGIHAWRSDMFSRVTTKYDIILCNPPYLPLDRREPCESQRATTGGTQGDEWIIHFLKQAPAHLEKKGSILLLLSSLTPRLRIEKLLKKKKLVKKVRATKNLFLERLEVWEMTPA